MIRKLVTATLMIALAALFYITDRIEQAETAVTVTKQVQKRVPASVKN
jgi:hypothetical protein